MDDYNCKEVANILGLKKDSIRVYAHKYKIGRKRGRDWFFTETDIEIIRGHMKKNKKNNK